MEYTECRALPSWLGQGARGRRQRTQRARRARRTRRTRRTGTRGPARGNVAAAWQGGSQFRFSIKRASPFHPKPAARNIDDLLFDIIVLRVHGGVADVVYLDDGNLEKAVPLDELRAQDCERISAEQQQVFEAGLEKLGDEPASPATASNMRWEQGKYEEEDGAIILSSCISVLTPEAVKDNAVMQACGTGLRGIRSLRKHIQVTAPAAA
ncbi:unnamed protein product [Effrenium voratum]|nr:unnamed protein product [Effrenium voratum]CAJ1432526.1 unnamed protein product [Effrenium voratum]